MAAVAIGVSILGPSSKANFSRCMTEELPPRLREVLKRLDEQVERKAGAS